jgi:transcriptional regulator with XRE-family HTH domain
MTNIEDFNLLGARHFGGVGWRQRLAQEIGVTRSTVSLWSTGKMDPPRAVVLWLRELDLRKSLQAALGCPAKIS